MAKKRSRISNTIHNRLRRSVRKVKQIKQGDSYKGKQQKIHNSKEINQSFEFVKEVDDKQAESANIAMEEHTNGEGDTSQNVSSENQTLEASSERIEEISGNKKNLLLAIHREIADKL